MGISIKEASEKLGLPAHTIRYYEKEGLLPFLQRDGHGNRVFEEKDLESISLMNCFRATGLPVATLKQMVDLTLQGDSAIPQRAAILREYKRDLERQQQELDQAFAIVNMKLSKYDLLEQGQLTPQDRMGL
ncbi:MerR family transcriptional regulator [Paenibacillus graminis]|uniref:MerR family transcriptional regulator n=1 Tax=Paenibacillus graminis TaxID=189425 RepID=UPI002DBFC236|nr:MerR family transcriptional regulator [Paenibacillus graminis]MEC0167524.1 MerR family transcriptional regulator [Paenibacillus graminis]